jgi:outer membrane usher protein
VPVRDRRRCLAAALASAAVIVPVCVVELKPALAADPAPGLAPDPPPDPPPLGRPAAEPRQTLLLEVVVNGLTTGKVAEFVERGGVLLVKRSDLTELGLRIPPGVEPATDSLYAIASLPNVAVRIDQATQTLYVTASDGALLPRRLHVATSPVPGAPLESALGATLNYDLTGAVTNGNGYGSGLFDLRVFSPLGVASTDLLAYAGSVGGLGQSPAIRLDSTYVYSDFAAQRRYWGGDFITGGLTWTRPVRLGGAQITHDFTMRPDLVTFPLPSMAGSVSVPSTVDVLVNGAQVLSRQVQPGPFEVPQLPVITGAGQVQLSVTNALGQQVTTTLPFYASPNLLAPGLHTYSLEAGFVRLNWGVVSNDYGAFAASGTYRRGLTDDVTIEAHAEGTKGQFMAGGGLVANAFNFAVVNLGAAASTAQGHGGGELSVGIERMGRVFSFGASGVFATSDFRDIAAMNGEPVPLRQLSANATAYLGKWGSLGVAYVQVDQPTVRSQVSVTGPSAFVPPGGPSPPSDVGLGNGSLPFAPSGNSRVLTATYSVQLRHAYLYATGFHDLTRGGGDGVSVGVTVPLGRRSSVTASANAQTGSPAYGQIQAQQSAVTIGDWGYQAYLAGGNGDHEFGQLQYKSPWALVTAGVDHLGGETTFRLDAQGAFSFADNRLFASNTVTDSFAVVDTNGAGDVRVLYENRDDGKTDASGRLLVPDLRAWDVNRLGIDPSDVPLDAQVPYTERLVRPPDRSGVVVKFPIRRTNGALLILVDSAGHPLPVGGTATLEATGVGALVGYDGEAFVEGLGKQNRVIVQLPNDGKCVVTFAYGPVAGQIPKIGPLTCRSDDR